MPLGDISVLFRVISSFYLLTNVLMNLPYRANTWMVLFSRYEMRMRAQEPSSIKNLIIHSALMELYYKQKAHISLDSLLSSTTTLMKFSLVEIVSAKIYSNTVIRLLPQYNSLEIFFASCLIFKKYWNDFSLKNIEETSAMPIPIKRLNRIEMEILRIINYKISVTKEQIRKEIEVERSVNRNYRRAMASVECIRMRNP